MAGLLSLSNKDEIISPIAVLRVDIMPWVACGAIAVGLYALVALLISGVSNSPHAFQFAAATLYQQPMVSYVLVALACFSARRSKQAWTWVVTGLLIIFSIPQGNETLAIHLFPNSILPAMIAMTGWLAIGRITEYIYIKRILKLANLTMTSYSISIYGMFAAIACVMNSSVIYDLFWKYILN